MKVINIGMLGLGNVGSGVYRILTENGADIQHRESLDIRIHKILVRDKTKKRNVAVDESLLTDRFEEILSDPAISVVAEFMGGIEPARSYMIAALKKGKTVVTANKEVISKHWNELEDAARATGAGLYFEAAVAGGIPVIRALFDSLQSNNISRVMGIINGTTNYMLSKMTDEHLEYQDVLKEAQQLGYAEPDPTADVEGYDAVYKLSILASLAFHARVPVDKIYHEGITKITAEDIKCGEEFGYVIKLLAIGKKDGYHIEARVHPTLIPRTHPLAAVRGPFNAVFVSGHAVGDLMFYGRGAGEMPTGSAVVSDIINASQHSVHQYTTFYNAEKPSAQVIFETDWQSAYYINIRVMDKPGVLARLTGVFGKHEVSIKSMLQKSAGTEYVPVVFITHQSSEKAVKAAVEEIALLDITKAVVNVIRVEE
ncbi:MAG: homoserine dehydrogenase [Christensenellales bacterium]